MAFKALPDYLFCVSEKELPTVITMDKDVFTISINLLL